MVKQQPLLFSGFQHLEIEKIATSPIGAIFFVKFLKKYVVWGCMLWHNGTKEPHTARRGGTAMKLQPTLRKRGARATVATSAATPRGLSPCGRLCYTEERNLFPFFGRAAAGREAASSLYGGGFMFILRELPKNPPAGFRRKFRCTASNLLNCANAKIRKRIIAARLVGFPCTTKFVLGILSKRFWEGLLRMSVK
ncbi:MAG: hypothetical protein LBI54_05265 [Lachnospiraceae bacterium]|jgi:hypothetical protein|nr:hypothetical protein [Lachnospiraceae bacterium]